MRKFISENCLYYLSYCVFKISLDMFYIYGTSIEYNYLGSILDFNLIKYSIGWLTFLTMIILINNIFDNDIKFIINILFAFSGISNITLYGLKNINDSDFFIVIIYWTLICLIAWFFSRVKLNNRNKGKVTFNFDIKTELLIVLSIMITVYLLLKFGSNGLLSLNDAYEARAEFRQQSLNTIDSYLMSWNAVVILPWCCLSALNKRKYFMLAIVLFLAMMMFSINGMKTWIILYVIIFCIYFLCKYINTNNLLSYILAGMSMMMWIALFIFYRYENYTLLGLVNRSIILPGEINYYYLDFFKNNDLLYLRESIFKVFDSPYNTLSSILISKKYMTAAFYHNATNGLLGDAFANFGIIGIFIYPVMINVVAKILKFIIVDMNDFYKYSIYFIQFWLLINTSFFTWIMTGGFALVCFIAFVFRKIKIKI